MNTTRWLALCAAVLAVGCGSPTPPDAPTAPPMDLRLGTPLLSRELPLKLSWLSYEYPSVEACTKPAPPFRSCIQEIVLCDKGVFTITFSDVIVDGVYTLSGDSLHATPWVGASFDGVLAEDGSFVSPQLQEKPFQNYERTAAEQKSLEKDCECLYNRCW